MTTSPYMPLYIADYLADAAHLTTEEHGAYMLLIMTYWQRGKPLPADPARLANIARMASERWASVERTLNEFFEVSEGEWRHKRIESELQRFRDKVEKAKAAGKASASNKKATRDKRTLNGRSTDAQRTLNHSESESDTEDSASAESPRERAAAPPMPEVSDLKRLSDRLHEVAGPVLASQAIAPGLASMMVPQMWLDQGCDLERDVVPTLQTFVARGKRNILSWDYFTRAVAETRAKRLAGLPAVDIQTPGPLTRKRLDLSKLVIVDSPPEAYQ